MDIEHQIGDRVLILHNIPLGNLIGTVTAIHYNTYEVTLDGGGKSNMFGFQLQNINELEDALASESQREAAGLDDEKPDGQAENATTHPTT